jgi:hypothetical protein
MKWQRIAVAIVATGAAVAAVAIPQFAANANNITNPTFVTTEPFYGLYGTSATDVAASGLITIAPLTTVQCNPHYYGHRHIHTASLVKIPTSLVSISALDTDCVTTKPTYFNEGEGAATSSATIAAVNLFKGKIVITAVDSVCSTGIDTSGEDEGGVPFATVGSTLATVQTTYSNQGTGGIVIPGIAKVLLDVNTSSTNWRTGLTTLTTDAIVIQLLPGAFPGVAAQTIVIGSCSITGYLPES